ncbi:MAG: hypothetical protein PF517_21390 [Salinivirgaceae bacterium]|jgi:hypothetical protein|nr:hypothetical protein [Salinivirgaceae bacterium]
MIKEVRLPVHLANDAKKTGKIPSAYYYSTLDENDNLILVHGELIESYPKCKNATFMIEQGTAAEIIAQDPN